MKFVELTYASNNDHPIYVNPSLIVGVHRMTQSYTTLLVAASSADGNLSRINVRELPADVIAKLAG